MESQSKESSSSDQPAPAQPQEKIITKVLIVDDEVPIGTMLQDILDAYDFQTAFAENVETALKLMVEFKPTVALVDFRLGETTGIELAHQLKQMDEYLPCILMTAYPSLDLAVKAIQSDIYDFLSKPVDKTYLLRSINKATEKRILQDCEDSLRASVKKH